MQTINKNNFLIELSESKRTSFGKIDFEKQSPAQKVFSSVWSVESEVNNGEFEQYFSNPSVETAGCVVGALTEIKAHKTAAICERAIQLVFPSGLPPAHIASDQAAEMDEVKAQKLEKYTDDFLKYPHDLTELLYDFVMSHTEEFKEAEFKEKPGILQKLLDFFK